MSRMSTAGVSVFHKMYIHNKEKWQMCLEKAVYVDK